MLRSSYLGQTFAVVFAVLSACDGDGATCKGDADCFSFACFAHCDSRSNQCVEDRRKACGEFVLQCVCPEAVGGFRPAEGTKRTTDCCDSGQDEVVYCRSLASCLDG